MGKEVGNEKGNRKTGKEKDRRKFDLHYLIFLFFILTVALKINLGLSFYTLFIKIYKIRVYYRLF